MSKHRAARGGRVVAYVGGLALVLSMLMPWPWIGRRGHLDGLQMIGRVRRVAELFDVPFAGVIAGGWFLLPLCGAGVMVLTSHTSSRARVAAAAISGLVFVEAVLLAVAYRYGRLDPWAGWGLVVALVGATLALVGSLVAALCERRSGVRGVAEE